MIEIIENRANKYIVTCDNCNSVLKFSEFDIKDRVEEYAGDWHGHTYIRCPCCKTKIILTIDGEIHTKCKKE